MKERPILFSTPMIRAERAGIKTQTRRAWRNQPPPGVPIGWVPGETKQPYGWPGDRLWVREAWRTAAEFDALPPRDIPKDAPIVYPADDISLPLTTLMGKPRLARFMCRWMSRTLLEVTDVRVQRLQDISEADCIAEGVTLAHMMTPGDDPGSTSCHTERSARVAYMVLWESINGTGSWALNPWVWAVSFKRIT